MPPAEHHKPPLGLRAVAVIEFAKGVVVLLAGLGLLSLIHRNVQAVAEEIVRSLHMDPAHRYPRIFIDAARKFTDGDLWSDCLMALMYAVVKFVEGYGLWHERLWAEWFAIVTTGLYMPKEIYLLVERPTWVHLLVLLANVIIIVCLGWLFSRKKIPRRGAEI